MSIYDYNLINGWGERVSLSNYKGKVLLIVNTATDCGFTSQYDDLQGLYKKLHGRGLEIIDIPCNQFKGQCPGKNGEIRRFCKKNYNTEFEQMKKSKVNGEEELPLYTYLKSEKGFQGFGKSLKAFTLKSYLEKQEENRRHKDDIRWNFTKFLVDREGNVVHRFEPTEDMEKVRIAIEKLL